MRKTILSGLMTVVFGAMAVADDYDLVLLNGRVMDPETRLDAVRNVGIADGTVKAVTEKAIKGNRAIDCTGLVVAPGFIDLHAHGMNAESARLQAADGVTTQLECEIGVYPMKKWLDDRAGTAIINYGASAGHLASRISVFHGIGIGHAPTSPPSAREALPSPDYAYKAADSRQIELIVDRVERALKEGGLGVGFGLGYTPGAEREEIFRVFQLAAKYDAPCFVHVRSTGRSGAESSLAAIQEVLAYAAGSGAPLHVVHLNSSGGPDAPVALEMILGARAQGLDITTEAYPYTAGSTLIESALFDEGWQDKHGIGYGDLEWALTGERLTQETFQKYREQGGWVIIHSMSDDLIDWAIGHPDILVASDGVPFIDGRAHPRGAGTFSRVLGVYVRDKGVLGLMAALEKITLGPARRLEGIAPVFEKKGRLQEGADADITVFDPASVIDRATFREPATPAGGIAYVIVNGTPVVDDGRLVEGVYPGRALRSRHAEE